MAETYAWVLMKNHFHLLVKIKDEVEIFNLSGLESTTKPLHQYFSNFFNAYTKALNKMYGRHGSLFERPFKRKLVEDIEHLKTVVIYIHNNPVHHGFTKLAVEYPWSSYKDSTSSANPSRIVRNEVLEWLGNEDKFKIAHDNQLDDDRTDRPDRF